MLNLIVIIIAVIGARAGWKRGFTAQAATILGVAFGAVAAHAFGDAVADYLFTSFPSLRTDDIGLILASYLGGAIVFIIVWLLFYLPGRILRPLLSDIPSTIIDQIFGAAFTLFEYLLFLSVAFNLYGFFAAYHYDDPPESMVIRVDPDDDRDVEWGATDTTPRRVPPYVIKSATDSDGNLAGAVGRLSPEAFGSLGLLELGHILQLHDARRIS